MKEADIVGAPWLFSACGHANIALQDGKHFVKVSRMVAIVLMVDMRNRWLPTLGISHTFQKPSIFWKWHRLLALGLRCTKD